jgi:hypothetical protein
MEGLKREDPDIEFYRDGLLVRNIMVSYVFINILFLFIIAKSM